MIVLDLPDRNATAELAARISALADPGDVIALKGDLGTGKTSFARAFIRARGREEEVPSPPSRSCRSMGSIRPPFGISIFTGFVAPRRHGSSHRGRLYAGISLIEWPERLGRSASLSGASK